MRPLAFDFQRRPRPHPAGWLLLLVGTVALAATLHLARGIAQDRHVQQLRLAQASARLAASSRAAAGLPQRDAGFAAARQALEQARLPWAELFAALEAAQGEDVALLTLAPEAARRQVRIQAEARDFAAMLAYQEQLQRQPGLAQVVLVDHLVMKDQPHSPVRFQVLAAWETRHGQP